PGKTFAADQFPRCLLAGESPRQETILRITCTSPPLPSTKMGFPIKTVIRLGMFGLFSSGIGHGKQFELRSQQNCQLPQRRASRLTPSSQSSALDRRSLDTSYAGGTHTTRNSSRKFLLWSRLAVDLLA